MIKVTIEVETANDHGVLKMLSAREHLWHDIGALLVKLSGSDQRPPARLSQMFSALELSRRNPMNPKEKP